MTGWIITSSLLILITIILRYILKGRISLRLQYALWIIVLIRLLIPVSFGSSRMSVLNTVTQVKEERLDEGVSQLVRSVILTQGHADDYEQPAGENGDGTQVISHKKEPTQYEANGLAAGFLPSGVIGRYACIIWLTGAAAMGLWMLLVNLSFFSRLKRTRSAIQVSGYPIKVYKSYAVDTACMLGLLHPAIYVAAEDMEDETIFHHVLEHETTHFLHIDHIWALMRCLCLIVHWYNPLVWCAAALSKRDAELACDEGTIKRIGEDSYRSYGHTLITLTCNKHRRGELFFAATTMTSSKKGIKERIVMIAKRPRMTVYTLVAVLIISAMTVGCTFTGARKGGNQITPEVVATKPEESTPEVIPENQLVGNTATAAQAEEKLYLISSLYDIFNSGGEMTIGLQISSEGIYKAYKLDDQSYAIGYGGILSNYAYTKVAKADTESSPYHIQLVSADGTKRMTLFNGSNTTVMYDDGKNKTYWSVDDVYNTDSTWIEYVSNPSLAGHMFNEYLNLCISEDNVLFKSGNAEEAAELFVKRIYREQCLDTEPPSKYSIKDYSVVKWGVTEVSKDGKAILGWMEYALIPEYPDLHGFEAGNTVEGDGEYKGWLVMYRQFVLQKQEDGCWHCIGLGTGGYALPE